MNTQDAMHHLVWPPPESSRTFYCVHERAAGCMLIRSLCVVLCCAVQAWELLDPPSGWDTSGPVLATGYYQISNTALQMVMLIDDAMAQACHQGMGHTSKQQASDCITSSTAAPCMFSFRPAQRLITTMPVQHVSDAVGCLCKTCSSEAQLGRTSVVL